MTGCRRRRSWFALKLTLLLVTAGCGKSTLEPREPFQCTHTWKVDDAQLGIRVTTKLQPSPLKAERPAMLEVRLDASERELPSTSRVWYRFAHRRGDPLPEQKDLAVRPTYTYEEGTPPRYEDWFEWAEILEPRLENGDLVFTTPVMMLEGKIYVQFLVSTEADAKPIELLDWFVYVDKSE